MEWPVRKPELLTEGWIPSKCQCICRLRATTADTCSTRGLICGSCVEVHAWRMLSCPCITWRDAIGGVQDAGDVEQQVQVAMLP